MSELRQDRTTGKWVIIAPERGFRPHVFSSKRSIGQPPTSFDSACPFCPGNEAKLSGILAETPSSGPPGWRSRVIPNKYPEVRPEAIAVRNIRGHHVTMGAHGYCEVVIESPCHDADIVSMSDDDIGSLVSVYRQRSSELTSRVGIAAAVLFRNRGSTSGASLDHPHTQLVALGMMPPRLLSMAAWAREAWMETGRCPTCDELEAESAEGSRIIAETPSFVALVPFASTVPFEIWLVPKRHQASFAEMDDSEGADLGLLLRDMLQRLKSAHNDPPYNFVVDSFERPRPVGAYVHWRLRIVPNLVTWGGFELGTSIPVTPSSPESDAKVLRTIIPSGEAGP